MTQPATFSIRSPPATLYPLLAEVNEGLYANGYLDAFRSEGGTLLVAMEGTDSFSSQKISGVHCTRQTFQNGNTLHRHSVVTPVVVAPGQAQVVPLPPEFVQPQDGQQKQDYELTAAGRWLAQWGGYYAP